MSSQKLAFTAAQGAQGSGGGEDPERRAPASKRERADPGEACKERSQDTGHGALERTLGRIEGKASHEEQDPR